MTVDEKAGGQFVPQVEKFFSEWNGTHDALLVVLSQVKNIDAVKINVVG